MLEQTNKLCQGNEINRKKKRKKTERERGRARGNIKEN